MEHELKALPCDTVRLIGSSQVITSVYSVVKELVENALDSEATGIDVKLENYGLDKVEVRDNGHGIRQANMAFVAKRYHTSKIASFNDLESLSTYGFRGEALGSLCAVSSLAITSKTAEESISNTCIFDHHGAILSTKPSHLGQGTTIAASELFKNLPVRRQFYNTVKKKKEELKRIEDLLMAFGCIKPGVRLLLKNGKDTVWQKNGVPDTRTALLGILGRNVMSQMEHRSVTCENPKVMIRCFLPCPQSDVIVTSKSTNDRCFIAVNSRPVYVKEIEKMVRQFYCGSKGVEGRYPVCYLALNVATTNIDVNVDPNKTRVMLQEQKLILSQIYNMLEEYYGPLKDKKEREVNKDNNSDSSQATDISSDLNNSDLSQDGGDDGLTTRREVTTGQTVKGHKVNIMGTNTATDKETCVSSGVKISFHGNADSDKETCVSSGVKISFHGNADTDKGGIIAKVTENVSSEGEINAEKRNSEKYCNSSKACFDTIKDLVTSVSDTMNTTDSDTSNILNSDKDNTSETLKGPDPSTGVIPDTEQSSSTQINQGHFDVVDDFEDLLKTQHGNKPDPLDSDLELDIDFLKACEYTESIALGKENTGDATSVQRRPDVKTTLQRRFDIEPTSNGLQVFTGENIGDDASSCKTIDNMGEISSATGQGINKDSNLVTETNPDKDTHIVGQSNEVLKWSIGKGVVGVNGSILQPVTLLAPNGSVTSNKRSRSFTEMESDLDAFTPPPKRKSLTVQADQPRLYDVVGKSPKEKYSFGFTAFSREERPKVLNDQPDLSYDDITKVVCQNWGKLSDDDKKHYDNAGKIQIEKLKKTVLEKQTMKTKVFKKVEQVSTIREKMFSSSTRSTVPIQTVKVKFCLQRLHTMYQAGLKQSQSSRESEMSLIGPLKFYNGWVCFHGNQVKVINPHRVEETILFRELMDNHVISPSKLDSPITLNEGILGQDLLQSLIELIPANSCQTYVYIEDKRITANGFQIRCHMDANNSPVLELDSISKSIPTFGVQDLKEVVQLIKDTAATDLQQCRPLKIIYYLQGEAVRMVRQRPLMRSRDDVQDILDQMKDGLPSDCVQCLHDKPFLHTIYDMDSIPVSQITQV